MGESAVALRYAEALYRLAQEAGRTREVLQDLAKVKAALDGDPEAWRTVMHPRTPVAEKEAYLLGRALSGQDRLVVNLVRLLLARRRESLLKDFFRAYLETHERHEGILRVEAETARPMEAAVREAIRERLAVATGKEIVLETREVPALLGGLRLLVNSRLIDGSLKTRLERIRRGLRSVDMGQS